MTNRDKLKELLTQAQDKYCDICAECAEDGYKDHESFEDFCADHLLANGVIVPPCHLNQTVWHITWNNRIEQCKVSSLTQKADGTFKIRITPPSKSVFEITPDKIGKTVFLTREEAERKLKELNNNGKV